MIDNYEAFALSVIGESHIIKNTECQDSSGYYSDKKYKIVVVSDGHGDTACFRSHIGSKLAVRACMEGLLTLVCETEKNSYEKKLKDIIKNRKLQKEFCRQLSGGIVTRWNSMVKNHLDENPILDELEKFGADDISGHKLFEEYRKGKHLNHIYGATLIGALITDDFIIALQHGDGKCIFLKKDGFCEPIPWDDRCIMNITTSLCDVDAANSFRYYISSSDDKDLPRAVFVATDGIEDSYDNNEAMLCFYRILLNDLCGFGKEQTIVRLENGWLSEISKKGSADDMSLGCIVDIDSIRPSLKEFELKNELCALNEQIRDIEDHLDSMSGKLEYLKKLCEEEINTEETDAINNNRNVAETANEIPEKNCIVSEYTQYKRRFDDLTKGLKEAYIKQNELLLNIDKIKL